MFCFKIHALLLSNSRAAVLRTAFFVNGNCCQLFHNFFSIKLGIYCCRQGDVNNFFCTICIEEFQLFKVLRLTIDNHHHDSGLYLLITLFRKRRIQLLSTLGEELFCHDGRPVGDEQSQETHTLCVFDRLPVVSWRRAKYKQMYGLKSTLTVSR